MGLSADSSRLGFALGCRTPGALLEETKKAMGVSVAARSALTGLAAVIPETGINIASTMRGLSDIGLGTVLGSYVITIPIMVVTAYITTRHLKKKYAGKAHEMHIKNHLLWVDRSAVSELTLPYLIMIAVVAVLTVPPQWRGMQPVERWIMLGMYLAFLTKALLRGRKE